MDGSSVLMKTLPVGTFVLAGKLVMSQPKPESRPVLSLSVWCPYCRVGHLYQWPDPPFTGEDVFLVRAGCSSGQLQGRELWIAMDPAHAEHNSRIKKQFGFALESHLLRFGVKV